MAAIDSLTWRPMPAPGVFSTNTPPARPFCTRIRCEPGQPAQALPQGRAAHPELAGEFVLGADPVAGPESLALDVAADLARDLLACVRVDRFEP